MQTELALPVAPAEEFLAHPSINAQLLGGWLALGVVFGIGRAFNVDAAP